MEERIRHRATLYPLAQTFWRCRHAFLSHDCTFVRNNCMTSQKCVCVGGYKAVARRDLSSNRWILVSALFCFGLLVFLLSFFHGGWLTHGGNWIHRESDSSRFHLHLTNWDASNNRKNSVDVLSSLIFLVSIDWNAYVVVTHVNFIYKH